MRVETDGELSMLLNEPLPQEWDSMLQKVAEPLEKAHTLPPAAYLNESIYRAEREALLKDVWHPVGRVEQVPEAGDYLCLELLGQPVVMVRGRDDQVRVLSSICLHRAAPVISGQGKQFKFTCPYHAWTYDLTGQLVRAPLMEGAEDFEEEKLCLPQATVEIWQGFVMANFSSAPSPFVSRIKGYDNFIAPFDLHEMQIVGTLDYHSEWNWKVLVENFMEAYHHIAIHSQTFEPNFHARDSQVPDNDGPWSILHMPAATRVSPQVTQNCPSLRLMRCLLRSCFQCSYWR